MYVVAFKNYNFVISDLLNSLIYSDNIYKCLLCTKHYSDRINSGRKIEYPYNFHSSESHNIDEKNQENTRSAKREL